MTNIHIERTHDLGLEHARTKVEEVAQSLRDEFQVECEWNGNRLAFNRAGVSGGIDVGPDRIDVNVELGMPLALLKGVVEDKINRRLDAVLG